MAWYGAIKTAESAFLCTTSIHILRSSRSIVAWVVEEARRATEDPRGKVRAEDHVKRKRIAIQRMAAQWWWRGKEETQHQYMYVSIIHVCDLTVYTRRSVCMCINALICRFNYHRGCPILATRVSSTPWCSAWVSLTTSRLASRHTYTHPTTHVNSSCQIRRTILDLRTGRWDHYQVMAIMLVTNVDFFSRFFVLSVFKRSRESLRWSWTTSWVRWEREGEGR